MASTSEAAMQLRTYPAFPAAPHRGGGEPVLFIAFFLRNPRGGGLPSDEAYLHGPVTNAQRLTSKAHMGDSRRRDARPSRTYGGEPGGRTPRRDARDSGSRRRGGREDEAATSRMPAQTGLTQPITPQPGAPARGEASRRAANGAPRAPRAGASAPAPRARPRGGRRGGRP